MRQHWALIFWLNAKAKAVFVWAGLRRDVVHKYKKATEHWAENHSWICNLQPSPGGEVQKIQCHHTWKTHIASIPNLIECNINGTLLFSSLYRVQRGQWCIGHQKPSTIARRKWKPLEDSQQWGFQVSSLLRDLWAWAARHILGKQAKQ